MELSQGLVKKYVFYNSGLFNKKIGIELMLLNFALILYAGFIYRNLIFLITICIGGMLNAIGAIIFLSKNSFFGTMTYFGVGSVLLIISLNCINFAHMKYYEFYDLMEFLLWVFSELIVFIPAFLLNKYMLFRMNRLQHRNGLLIESVIFLGAAVGSSTVMAIKSLCTEGQVAIQVFYWIIIIIYLSSIVVVGFFYKAYLIKKYKLVGDG